jgi:hypothetical protein
MKGTALVLLAAAVLSPAANAASPVGVQLDRTSLSTRIGGHFAFTSTVRNRSGRPLEGLVAHLNVLSLDPSVYVDPEDWSSHRSRYLTELPSRGTTRLPWTVQAVNSGPIVVYVSVIDATAGTVAVSQPLQATIRRQRTLNAGGVVPLALAVPGGIALLVLTVRRQRKRR